MLQYTQNLFEHEHAKAVMLDNYMRVIAFGCLTPLSSIYQLIVDRQLAMFQGQLQMSFSDV
jgi:hypothetical protein